MSELRLPPSSGWQQVLAQHDFSAARGQLIGSVPGYHAGGWVGQGGHRPTGGRNHTGWVWSGVGDGPAVPAVVVLVCWLKLVASRGRQEALVGGLPQQVRTKLVVVGCSVETSHDSEGCDRAGLMCQDLGSLAAGA